MKIKIVHRLNPNISDDELKVILESSKNNNEIKDIIEHIKEYKKEFIVKKESKSIKISYNDIVLFYSKGKENYCKTIEQEEYKLKKRLYEIEKLDHQFIRISKNCIVNKIHIKCFDMSESGKILIKLDTGDTKKVSRRRIRDIFDYLDERSI